MHTSSAHHCRTTIRWEERSASPWDEPATQALARLGRWVPTPGSGRSAPRDNEAEPGAEARPPRRAAPTEERREPDPDQPDEDGHHTSTHEQGSFSLARCTCGWHGPARRARDRARADALEHRASA
ncbi:hypothetical protein [Streptomyces sp. NPDC005438]|uniref:hypothetical protein n=1 Tax=Streptomyces sp. NPDC005438 TaxID=3156880 RepID=UPI0033A07E75